MNPDDSGTDDMDEELELEAYALDDIRGKTIKEHIVDVDAMKSFTAELQHGAGEFQHHLTLEMASVDEKLLEDDLKREQALVEAAKAAAQAGLEKLVADGIPFRRPADYFADMLKTDEHMHKVRGRLQAEKDRIDSATKKRAARDNSKTMKKRQREKEIEKKKREKDEISQLENLRKQRAKAKAKGPASKSAEGDSDDGSDDFPVDLIDAEEVDPSLFRGKGKRSDKSSPANRKFSSKIQSPEGKRGTPKKNDRSSSGGDGRLQRHDRSSSGSHGRLQRHDGPSGGSDARFGGRRGKKSLRGAEKRTGKPPTKPLGGVEKRTGRPQQKKRDPKKRPGKQRRQNMKSKRSK